MKTQVFESYIDFIKREDKSINGVSPEFAKNNPDYEVDNNSNIGCWNCRGCKECQECIGSEECEECYECNLCKECVKCTGCRGVKGAKGAKGLLMKII